MPALPDRALMRAVADVVIDEEKARAAADRELAGDLARLKERIDEYGNVIETKFLGLDMRLRDLVAAQVAAIVVPPGERGEKGERGEIGNRGEPGERGADGERGEKGDHGERGEVGERGLQGEQGEQGLPGDAGYPGRAYGLHSATVAYRALDVVAFNGSEWRAKVDNPGPLPGDGWMLSAKGVKGEKGERGNRGEPGERGAPGAPGPAGVGIADIVIEQGLLIIVLTNGTTKEFALEAA